MHPRSLALLLALGLATFACGDGPTAGSPPTPPPGPLDCRDDERVDDAAHACKPIGWSACPTGFVAAPEGHGCIEVLASAACAPGTMPALGQTTCKSVGIERCATGFVRDATGWGCVPTIAPAACAGATKETIGRASCEPIGDCAAAFPPADATVFVDASFADGQLDATHFRTIDAAIAAAASMATIAVAPGTYAADLTPAKPVRMVGRCAAQVSIAASVAASGVDVVLERVTIAGGGATAGSGAKLTLRDVVVDAARATGIVAKGSGTTLVVDRSAVRGSGGLGIDVGSGADVTVRDSSVTDNEEMGIRIAGAGAHGRIERSAVLRTKTTATDDFGVGAIVRDGAIADIVGSAFVANHEIGVVIYGKGTKATVTDVAIDDTQTSGEGYGRGMFIDGATATLERVSITRSKDAGIVVEKAGQLVGRSVAVADTQEGAEGNGLGVVVLDGASASFTASAFAANRDAGLSAVGAGSKLALEGSIVTATRADRRSDRGYGIAAESGASVELRTSALVANTAAGIAAIDPGTRVTIAGTAVLDTKPAGDGRLGRGVSIENGATATVAQSAVARSHDIGISARGKDARATIDETVVRETQPQTSNGFHGRGIEAGSGASVVVSRASILANRSVGVLAISAGSSAEVTDSWIADTTADGSPEGPGRAATAQGGATLSLTGVWAQKNTQIGVLVAAGSTLAMKSSVVEATTPSAEVFGHGVFAFDGSLATLADVTVRGNAAVGLFFAGSRGTVQGTRVLQNAIGIHVQDGTTLTEAATVPEDPPEGSVVVSSDSEFVGNASRVGSGALPVPSPVE